MKGPIISNGKNITSILADLHRAMNDSDATGVVIKAQELVEKLPGLSADSASGHGLLLGLVQSGKTSALITSIAMAADNGYTCFVVLTSDNLWLYDQTINRLKTSLPGLQVEGKFDWDLQASFMPAKSFHHGVA